MAKALGLDPQGTCPFCGDTFSSHENRCRKAWFNDVRIVRCPNLAAKDLPSWEKQYCQTHLEEHYEDAERKAVQGQEEEGDWEEG